MEIAKFLSLGDELETQISGLYEKIAALTHDDTISNKLIKSLEKSFEKVHIGASVVISDAHLKKLFQALAKGDQDHIKTLQEMISNIK